MGDFRIEILATGGHGCQREIKDGDKVNGCGRTGCPDCETRRFLMLLKTMNYAQVKAATITHWPGDPSQVVDDLVTGIRRGSF